MLIFCDLITRRIFSRTFQIQKRTMEVKTYENAIETLNRLQSNSQYIMNAVIKPKAETNLAEVAKFLKRTGLSRGDLDKLSIIHIAGTNGKGTTCAYCETILRNHGFKTGFFSSPHLLDVRERIRINGKPISKDEFASHFWRLYYLLDKQKEEPNDMPLYFRYLTLLAFHVFIKNNVDVAVIEVGIGGEYDCTNVIRKTPVAGITPLDMDHTALLGNSMESIAWNKAGIMKSGSLVFTTDQPEKAMKVLVQRSLETKCELKVVAKDFYKPGFDSNIPLHVQKTNASLALAITEAYITKIAQKKFSVELAKQSIEETHWAGRYEIIQLNNIRFFLDGAHTIASLTVCANWFKEKSYPTRKKALIFNLTGDRKPDTFFKELRKCSFDVVIFTPNVGKEKDVTDNMDFISPPDVQLQRCNEFQNAWLKLEEQSEDKVANVLVFNFFSKAVEFLENNHEYDVLVTGSIHLVGAALTVLDPTLRGMLTD